MARIKRVQAEVPACFAVVHPGLEPIAADEITRDLGGVVKKAERGIVVFRVDAITPDLLELRTVEDLYLFAWGTDSLTHRAMDLNQIRQWTVRDANWKDLFHFHHQVRPQGKRKPTYRLITQKDGTHGYRRIDAQDAYAEGLRRKIPETWRLGDDDAWVEMWLIIRGPTAIAGVRLSDRTMRHRTYKVEHLKASLRPTVAAAMVRLAGAGPGDYVLDPMCGAATILAEQIELSKLRRAGRIETIGGDLDMNMLRAARSNLAKVGPAVLANWDARTLPLATDSVQRIICNMPFGKQVSTPEEIGPLYQRTVRELDRVLQIGGRAVLLVSEMEPLRAAIRKTEWKALRQLDVEVLGQDATISVWNKL
ncbi:MAG: methyltransferase domain-containing protein [Zavarzinella sp.]